MSYDVELLPSARKQIRGLPREMQERVVARLEALSDDPRPPGSLSLVGNKKGLRRIRVGDYRVVYRVDDSARVVEVTNINHRHDVYK